MWEQEDALGSFNIVIICLTQEQKTSYHQFFSFQNTYKYMYMYSVYTPSFDMVLDFERAQISIWGPPSSKLSTHCFNWWSFAKQKMLKVATNFVSIYRTICNKWSISILAMQWITYQIHPNVIFEKDRPTRYVRAYMLKGTLSDGKTWTGVIRTVKSGRCPARTRVEMTSTQFVQGKRNVCLGMINCFLAAQDSFIEIKCFTTYQRHLGTRFVKSTKLWVVNFIKTY